MSRVKVALLIILFILDGFPSTESFCINSTYVVSLFSTKYLPLSLDRTRLAEQQIDVVRLRASINDTKVAKFADQRLTIDQVFYLNNPDEDYNEKSPILINLPVRASYINRTTIDYSLDLIRTNNETIHFNCSIVLLVSQPQRFIDRMFKGLIPFVVSFVSIQMGVLLDLQVLKELMRRPIQVLIGFVCQYMLMPLIAFAITKLFRYEPLYGLGLFVVGCCPGGYASNQWTVMFDGDINLSAFMSFASTVASFVMMPIWLYTLGQYAYLDELHIRIPFLNLGQSLMTIIGPLGLGMIIVYFIPKVKALVERIVKPTLLFLIVYFFIFGAFANYYLFYYLDLRTALTAPFLPWLGFVLGGVLAWICRQDQKRIITIGIETGIQNVGIAFMVLLYSLPAPENTQATVIPLVVAYLSAQPFHLILVYRFFSGKFCLSKKTVEEPSVSMDRSSKASEPLTESDEQKVPLPLVVSTDI